MLKKIAITMLTLSVMGVIIAGSDSERARQLITELKNGTVSFEEVDWKTIDWGSVDRSLIEELRALKMKYGKAIPDKTAVKASIPRTQKGGMRSPDILFFEDWDGGGPGLGAWTTVNRAGPHTWEVPNPGWGNWTGGTGNSCGANSDWYWEAFDDELITPPIDCSGYQNVSLTFKHAAVGLWVDDYWVHISNDGGSSWNLIVHWLSPWIFFQTENYDISGYADGQSDVRIRFWYDTHGADWQYWWDVDDITIEGEPAAAGADIEVVSIDAPGTWGVDPDTVWAGATYQPVATVRNNGPGGARLIEVTCTCNGYTCTKTIDFLPAGGETQVTFDCDPSWTTSEEPCNIYDMRVEATHPEDGNPDNNWKEKQYENLVDMTVVSIDAPPDVILTGTTYMPKATIQNSSPEGFFTGVVTCWIEVGGGRIYESPKPITHLEHGTTIQVEFDAWTSFLSACTTYTMTVGMGIPCDVNGEDNVLDKTLDPTGDVSITTAIVPTESVYVDTKYFPTVMVANLTQGITEGFPCSLYIEDENAKVIYLADLEVDGFAEGEEVEIFFDGWIVPPGVGEWYTLHATSYLPCDDDTPNDTLIWSVKSVAKGALDVGVFKINTSSSVAAGKATKPDATVQNYGENAATFDVICLIQPSGSRQVYEDTATINDLAPDDTAKIVFKDWTPDAGSYVMWVKTFLIGDMNAANDSLEKTINATGIAEVKVPTEFALSCIKPNPFSLNTEISYQVPHSSEVSLAIYDVSGKHIKTLVTGTKDVGSYTAIWDGRDSSNKSVPAGIYFVKLLTPEYKATRKVILLTR